MEVRGKQGRIGSSHSISSPPGHTTYHRHTPEDPPQQQFISHNQINFLRSRSQGGDIFQSYFHPTTISDSCHSLHPSKSLAWLPLPKHFPYSTPTATFLNRLPLSYYTSSNRMTKASRFELLSREEQRAVQYGF